MLTRYLLCALCLFQGVFPRVLPSAAQIPLVSLQHDYAKPEHMGVMIAFKRSGEDREATFQFPMRQPIQGSVLHNDPWHDTRKAVDSVKIVALLDLDTATAGPSEELARVRCRIEPEFSIEEVRAASALGAELGIWPTFGLEDGVIILDRSDSRWFLAGRSIKSIECW